jgi:hypothetical protein
MGLQKQINANDFGYQARSELFHFSVHSDRPLRFAPGGSKRICWRKGAERSLILLKLRKKVAKRKLTRQRHTTYGVDVAGIILAWLKPFQDLKDIVQAIKLE